MIKRILIVVMLISMLFCQYAGGPSQGYSSVVWHSAAPVMLAINDTNPTHLPQVSGSVLVPEPSPTFDTASKHEPLVTPTPGNTSLPSIEANATPEAVPQETQAHTSPILQEAPTPQASPAVQATPVPQLNPIPQITPSSDPVPQQNDTMAPAEIDISPLVAKLPDFDPLSTEALKFKADMDSIVDKAVKLSKIKSTYGIMIMDLKTELYYGINEDITRLDETENVPEGYFNSASVIKLFQGYIFCDMIRRGELDAEKTYYDQVTGRKFKLIPMLKSMISYSDNNYSNACLRIVDNKKSNEVLRRLGIHNSRLYGEMNGAIGYSRENNIKKYGTDKRCARLTPRDTALILYNIYRNKDTDPLMKALNEGLIGNIYNTRIPVGVKRVSSQYKVAHKTGTNSSIGVYNDAGIVYCKNPYILVAFTQDTTSSAAHTFIRSLAEQLTRYFDQQASSS